MSKMSQIAITMTCRIFSSSSAILKIEWREEPKSFNAHVQPFLSPVVGDAYLVAHQFTFFCSNFVGLFDAGEHAVTQYGLRSSSFYASYLLYDCEPVLLGKWVLPNPRHKRLQHINNLCKRRMGTIMLRLAKQIFLMTTAPKLFLK